MFPWAQERFKEELHDLKLSLSLGDVCGADTSVRINEVRSVEGEMVAMNRKGKLLFIYDVQLHLRWEAVDGDTKAVGDIKVRDIATDEDEPVYQVRLDDCSGDVKKLGNEVVKELKTKQAQKPIEEKIAAVLNGMSSQLDGVLAKTDTVEVITPDGPVRTNSTKAAQATAPAAEKAAEEKGVGSIELVLEWDVPAQPLFESFVDPGRIQAYTGAPASVSAAVDAPLSFYGGAVQGKVVKVDPNRHLQLQWRNESWPSNHFSTVDLTFMALEGGGRTRLTLKQTRVPRAELERTRGGWENYFWSRLRGLFGWNYKVKN